MGTEGRLPGNRFHLDLRVGGKWSINGVGPNGTAFHMEGKYLEVDPPRRLVQTRKADFVGEFETVVRWELEPRDVHGLQSSGTHRVGTGTIVKIRHSGFAGHLEQAHSHHKGWSASLERLQAFVEKGETMETRH